MAIESPRFHLARALELHENALGSGPEAVYEVFWPYAHVLQDLTQFEWRRRWFQLWALVPRVVEHSQPDLAAAIAEARAAALSDPRQVALKRKIAEIRARVPAGMDAAG